MGLAPEWIAAGAGALSLLGGGLAAFGRRNRDESGLRKDVDYLARRLEETREEMQRRFEAAGEQTSKAWTFAQGVEDRVRKDTTAAIGSAVDESRRDRAMLWEELRDLRRRTGHG